MKKILLILMIFTLMAACSGQKENPFADREIYLRENISRISMENFPDNQNNTWKILSFSHDKNLTYVEVEPDPKDVGYDRFKYAMNFSQQGQPPVCVGAYSWEKGIYSLLFTDDGWETKLPKVR